MRVFLTIAAICAALFVGGFLHFAGTVSRLDDRSPPSGDAIIVLTGGSQRITAALDLLANGHARRLLITGVNPATSVDDLARVAGTDSGIFSCCVDLDYEADNTVGNADQAKDWVARHGYSRLVVVTSNYHMPRSLMEFSRTMPEVTFLPFAVPAIPDEENSRWWRPETGRLYAAEYVKYVVALFRTRYLAWSAVAGEAV